jgi:hypothetical protein
VADTRRRAVRGGTKCALGRGAAGPPVATRPRPDEPVLLGGILIVSLLLGADLDVPARRLFVLAAGGIALVATLGVVAALADDRNPVVLLTVLVGMLGAAAGIAVLYALVVAVASQAVPPEPTAAPDAGATPALSPVDRRRFLA